MNKQAKFFCENCHNEVNANARFCPTCGKFFSSVKCPMCGAVGSAAQFKDGCPKCGYAEGKSSKKNSKSSDENLSESEGRYKFSTKTDKRCRHNDKNRNFQGEDSLPLWIYIISIIVLVTVIVLFVVLF